MHPLLYVRACSAVICTVVGYLNTHGLCAGELVTQKLLVELRHCGAVCIHAWSQRSSRCSEPKRLSCSQLP